MSPAHDLMERLAAAEPVADPRQPDAGLDSEMDDLLARLLATPTGAVTGEARRARYRRHWPKLAAATALVAVAAFAALSLLDSDDGPAPNVVAEAVAALTQKDAVYHAAIIGHARSSTEPMPRSNPYEETWHTAGGRLHSRTYRAKDGGKGRLLSDFAGQRRPGRLGGPAMMWTAYNNEIFQSGFGRSQAKHAPTVDPFDPGRSLKELQAEGKLRVAGEVTVDGRRAYRLVSGDVESAGHAIQSTVIIVDAETYFPIRQRLFSRADGESARETWDYVIYERLPLNERTSALLDFNPPRGAKCGTHSDRQFRKGSLGFPNPCAK